MDPLSWALMTWLAIAIFLFMALQKAVELWPPAGEEPHAVGAANSKPVPSIEVRRSSVGSQVNIKSDTEIEAEKIVAKNQEEEAIKQTESTTTAAAPSPAATPPPSDRSTTATNTAPADNAKWVNEFISWLHHRYKGVPDASVAWLKSLNDAAKKVTSPSSCEVLFEHLIESTRVDAESPRLYNIRTDMGPRDHLTFIADIFVPEISLHLVSSQKTADRLLVSNYDARITDLRGEAQVRLACIANELFAMGCFNGRPGMRIELVHTDANSGAHVNPDLVAEAIRKCIISAVTNISLNQVNMRTLTIQQAQSVEAGHSPSSVASSDQHSPSPASQVTQVPKSTVTTLTVQAVTPQPSPPASPNKIEEVVKRVSDTVKSSPNATPLSMSANDKLLVKVIRAQKLGSGNQVHQPFVCMELDEPSTRQHTTKGINLSPYWEEEFTFDLSDKSEELLFEIYDGYAELAQPTFLGLAIVSLSEVRKSTQCIQTLPLQSRPYYNDPATGNLTVEFIFMPATKLKSGELGKAVREQQHEYEDGLLTETEAVTRRQLGPDEAKVTPTTTTTVMIKSVSQYFQEPVLKPDEPVPSGGKSDDNEPEAGTSEPDQPEPSDVDDTSAGPPVPPRGQPNKPSDQAEGSVTDFENQSATDATNESSEKKPAPSSTNVSATENGLDHSTEKNSDAAAAEVPNRERARSKESVSRQSGTFFTQLKDRMSFSTRRGRRSKSVEAQNGMGGRSGSGTLPAGAKARDPSEGRYASSMYGGSQTEQSIVSGVSTRSLYTRSTLIVELNRNDVKKFYLIPPNMLDNGEAKKLMRRGKKLHVFNEHTFVAVRIRGGSMCNVCGLAISRSFGRQAYQCRDCRLVCHKQCHHKTDVFCPSSNVSSLEILRRRHGRLKSVSFNETINLLSEPKPAERTLKRVHLGRSVSDQPYPSERPLFMTTVAVA